MKPLLMSRIYCGRDSFVLDENDVVLYNGHIYQVLTRTKVDGWHKSPLKLSKTNASLLIRRGILKTNEEFSKEQTLMRQMILDNLTFYYFDMEKFKEFTNTSKLMITKEDT
jgi:phage pi2 protein 07